MLGNRISNGLGADRATTASTDAVETLAGSVQRQHESLCDMHSRIRSAFDQLNGPVPLNAKEGVEPMPNGLAGLTEANERLIEAIRSQTNELLSRIGL